MSTFQTKNKIKVIRETDQIAQIARCFLTGVYLLKAARPPDCRPAMWPPFREFFIGGVEERPWQKGRMLVLLKGQSPSLFPLINFPFLAWLPGSLSFSLHSPYNNQSVYSRTDSVEKRCFGQGRVSFVRQPESTNWLANAHKSISPHLNWRPY